MELNLQMQQELRRLSALSAQINEAENRWEEMYTNRLKAAECCAEPHILRGYSDLMEVDAEKIYKLKNMIVEHVHVLVALMAAQGED